MSQKSSVPQPVSFVSQVMKRDISVERGRSTDVASAMVVSVPALFPDASSALRGAADRSCSGLRESHGD